MLTWERETGKGASCTNCTSGGRTLNIYPNLKKPYIPISLRMQGLLFADEDECTAYYFSMYIACHKGNCDPNFLQCQKKTRNGDERKCDNISLAGVLNHSFLSTEI